MSDDIHVCFPRVLFDFWCAFGVLSRVLFDFWCAFSCAFRFLVCFPRVLFDFWCAFGVLLVCFLVNFRAILTKLLSFWRFLCDFQPDDAESQWYPLPTQTNEKRVKKPLYIWLLDF